MNKYKMRAECQIDVCRFLNRVSVDSCNIETTLFPDVDVEFTSNFTLDEIRKELGEIEDAHVMLETVELAANYTGERK